MASNLILEANDVLGADESWLAVIQAWDFSGNVWELNGSEFEVDFNKEGRIAKAQEVLDVLSRMPDDPQFLRLSQDSDLEGIGAYAGTVPKQID